MLCCYYLQDMERTVHYLGDAYQNLHNNVQMIQFITDLQCKLISDAGVISHQSSSSDKQDLQRLIQVGTALISERDFNRLLELIIDNFIEITGAERGFLMLEENDCNSTGHQEICRKM